jgi:hypothetical protein
LVRRFSKTGLVSALVLSSLLTLSQCGFPVSFLQLIAPLPIFHAGTTIFEFRKTTDAGDVEPEFRGFELYYRFFEAVPGNVVFADTYEELISNGYRRVYSADDRVGSIHKPLIRVDPADYTKKFTITVSFNSITPPDDPRITASDIDSPPLAPPLDAPISDFRRGVVREVPSNDIFKQFSEFASTDADVASIWSSFQISGKLVLYVLSYGYDVSQFGQLYSEPVYLGEISRDFIP